MSVVVTNVEKGKDAAAAITVLRTGATMRAEEAGGNLEALKYSEKEGHSAGFDVAYTRGGPFLSQMRLLRRKVLDATASRRKAGEAPLVLITSAAPGDGKSFITWHLSRSLTAERDLGVVLMDCDIVRQRISRLFTGTDDGGLSSCLEAGVPLSTVIRTTEVQRLAVVRAGENTPTVTEALTSSRWDRVVAEMRACGSSRFFIADSSPVLALAEAQYLARTADLVLFVVRAEVTPQPAVAEALARLTDVPRIAFVFNGDVSAETDLYYDYSNYGSAHTATHPDKKK